MNNNYVKLTNNLENLNLIQIKNNIDKYIDLINENKKTVIDALFELTTLEMDLKHEKAMNACVRVANFPFIKYFNEFDFSFQPSINKDKILDFANFFLSSGKTISTAFSKISFVKIGSILERTPKETMFANL